MKKEEIGVKDEEFCGEIGGTYLGENRNFGETEGICMKRGGFEANSVEMG